MANELDSAIASNNEDNFNTGAAYSKFDTQMSIASQVAGAVEATVVDAGASIWNSLTPEKYNVDEADLMSKVSKDAANMYDAHPDAIGAAGFIVGSFIPAGFALKGMKALRAGAKGASWFSSAARAENLAKLDTLVQEGGAATKEVRALSRTILRNGVLNNVVDAAAVEAATITAMNSAPMMEDYWQDPVSNFAVSLAFGGVLGGGIGAIIDNAAINAAKGTAERGILKTVFEGQKDIPDALPNIGKLQAMQSNIDSWKNLVKEDSTASPAVKELTNYLLLDSIKKQDELFKTVDFKEVEALSPEVRKTILDSVVGNVEFSTTNKLKFYAPSPSEEGAVLVKAGKITPSETNVAKPVVDTKTGVTSINDSVYFPEYKQWLPIDTASRFSRFVTTGKGIDDISKEVDVLRGVIPREDAYLTVSAGNTIQADGQHLKDLYHVDRMNLEKIGNALHVDANDISLMDAILARAKKSPDEMYSTKITIGKTAKAYSAEDLDKASKGVSSQVRAMQKISANDSAFNLANSSKLSSLTKSVIDKWAANDKESKGFLQRSLQEAKLGTLVTGNGTKAKEVLTEIGNSAESKALRKHLQAEHGDTIYLYKSASMKGRDIHSPITSFSAIASKNSNVYKIATKDVAGYVHGANGGEFLVASANSPRLASRNIQLDVNKYAGAANSITGSVVDLQAANYAAKENAILGLIDKKEPLERISILTNTPLETVQAFATGERSVGLDELAKQGFATSYYDNAEKIPEYLAATNRPIRASHSVQKLAFSDLASKIDVNNVDSIQREFIASLMASSKSKILQSYGDRLFGDGLNPLGMRPIFDQIRQGVHELTNSTLGNAFLESSDFFLRNTTIGKQISYIGKEVADVGLNAGKALSTPIAERMGRIAKNEVEVIEALTFLNENAKLKGWRDIVDGTLVQKVTQKVTTQEVVGGILKDVTKNVEKLEPVLYQGKPYKIVSQNVLDLVDAMRASGKEAFEMKNSINAITGRSKLNDLGLWVPSMDFRNKQIAYVWNPVTQKTSILWGRTVDELKENIGLYKKGVDEKIVTNLTIATKDEQALWNSLNGRLDPLTMEIANVEQQRTGSASSAIVKANTDQFTEMLGAYDYLGESYIKKVAQLTMSDTLDVIDKISAANTRASKGQTADRIFSFLNKEDDHAAKVKNILLGSSNLKEYSHWKNHNENFETVVNWGIGNVSSILRDAVAPLGGIFGKASTLTEQGLAKANFEIISRKLEAAGIPNPWAEFDNAVASQIYGVAKLQDARNVTKRLVYAGNAFAATMALRLLDLGSPLVNAMSVPILTTLAKTQNLPETLMGAMKAKGPVPSVAEIMHGGFRLSASEHGVNLNKKWEEMGLFGSYVSEANAVMRASRQFESGNLTHVENALNSKIVEWMSKPADITENFIRRKMMNTGYTLAKKMYPQLDDTGATIFARDFMDRSLGNYHSGQRPVFFQGTMGVALGLFQTYMLTLAQNVYRGIELKDIKGIGKAMLAQSTIFGASSLPGFDMVSQTIGDHFSEDNFDLTTGTYRAIGDNAANVLLYGVPSSLGPALNTRGDISPRIASPISSMDKIAAVNMVTQTMQFGSNMASAVASNGGSVPNAVAQAISLQSVSRPLARVSELFTGHSVSNAGDTFATPDEVYTATGIASRVLGARPTMEAKAREALYLDRNYGRIDRDHRMEVTKELKTAVRNGTLTDDKLSSLADSFMRKGGSANAWRKTLNEAYANTSISGQAQIKDKLRPDSPLNYMIDSLDGEAFQ